MIELPTEISDVEVINPRNMILFGLPKIGKTTILSKLPNHFIGDLEEGTGFIKCRKLKVPKHLGPVGKFKWVKEVAEKIKADGYPYDFVIWDTLTEADEWSEWVGTLKYMNSLQGKNFNRYTKEDHPNDQDKWGEKLPFSHPDYESVHSLKEGYGYRWSRDAMMELYNEISDLGKICTIFVCHVTDAVIGSKEEVKKEGKDIVTKQIALTGKVKHNVARKVDAIGYIFNKDGEAWISFKNDEEKVGGIRGEHLRSLQGYEGPLDWNKIFAL